MINKQYEEEDNRTSTLSLKCIRLSLDSLSYLFWVDDDLSLSKTNKKDIPYIDLLNYY
ncbi:hypothetical protein H8356DRAFT_1359478 [Neocallimastix lanati (nom. inval.)]|nr:hypothetical protein H8356DRAFT_1359478 [Neocallimastix sp. JGI-2020a]